MARGIFRIDADMAALISKAEEKLDFSTLETASAASQSEGNLAMGGERITLNIADLLPDNGGAVVLSGEEGAGIELFSDVSPSASGVSARHTTDAGLDVSGYHYFSFDNGVTVYFPDDLDLLVSTIET